jgi:hypothetical protein
VYAHAVLGCYSQWLPPLPTNAAWTSDNTCNIDSTLASKVPVEATCTADCLPGFIKTGSTVYRCFEVPDEAGSYFFDKSEDTLACTGTVWDLLGARASCKPRFAGKHGTR